MPDTNVPTKPSEPNPMAAFMQKVAEISTTGSAPPTTAPPTSPAPPPSPAPAAPAKPAEPPPAEPTKLDPAKLAFDKPSKSEQWREVKAAKEAAERKAQELEAKLAKLGDVETLMKSQEELANLRRQLREVAVERDPEFQSQYQAQRKAHIAEARDAVGPDLADEVERILDRYGEAAGPRIRDLVKEHNLDQFAATQLASAVTGLRNVEVNKRELARRSAENWDKNVTEQTLAHRRAQEQALAARQQALDALLEEHKEHPLLKPKDEKDTGPSEALAVAKRVAALDLEPDELARVALMSATYPRVLGALQESTSRIAELEAQLTELRGAQPRAGNGTFAPKGGGTAKLPDLPKPGEYNPTLSAASLWEQTVRQAGM